ADVGDPAVALFVHDRLIGASSLQVMVADELHVALFGLRRPLGGWGVTGLEHEAQRDHRCPQPPTQMFHAPPFPAPIRRTLSSAAPPYLPTRRGMSISRSRQL